MVILRYQRLVTVGWPPDPRRRMVMPAMLGPAALGQPPSAACVPRHWHAVRGPRDPRAEAQQRRQPYAPEGDMV